MGNYKIVITGAYAAGKTQFIRSVSEVEVIDTEAIVTNLEEKMIKTHTTVGLDYGILTIDSEHKLFLFGTPGQERFDFMWEVLAEGCLGYIVLMDSCRPAHFVETAHLVQRFASITSAPFVVAANKQDDPSSLPPSYIRRRLGIPLSIPVVPCIASDPASVRDVLLTLLERVDMVSATAE